jgi:hypothetical protein
MAAQWYARISGKDRGPFSSALLKELANDKTIARHTPVRNGVDGEWVLASRVIGLFEGGAPFRPPPVRETADTAGKTNVTEPSLSPKTGMSFVIPGIIGAATVVGLSLISLAVVWGVETGTQLVFMAHLPNTRS